MAITEQDSGSSTTFQLAAVWGRRDLAAAGLLQVGRQGQPGPIDSIATTAAPT
jgi:hypothetical protein